MQYIPERKSSQHLPPIRSSTVIPMCWAAQPAKVDQQVIYAEVVLARVGAKQPNLTNKNGEHKINKTRQNEDSYSANNHTTTRDTVTVGLFGDGSPKLIQSWWEVVDQDTGAGDDQTFSQSVELIRLWVEPGIL